MRLIDSHCHLNYEGLVQRQSEVLESARARGVSGFLNISTRQREWNDVIGVAERHVDVWATVGVHPHEADAHPDLGAKALMVTWGPRGPWPVVSDTATPLTRVTPSGVSSSAAGGVPT